LQAEQIQIVLMSFLLVEVVEVDHAEAAEAVVV
jgi:hypothetical protein